MEKTIDLERLLKSLRKNLMVLLLLPIASLVLGLLISLLFIQPKYEATSQVLVNQKETSNDIMAQQVQSNIQLVKTYSEIIKSPRILDKVSKKLNDKYSEKELTEMLSVNNQAESQILNITVKSNNKNDSMKIANTISQVFSKDANKIMNIDNVSTLSKAEEAKKVSPKLLVNGIVSLIIGLVIALLLIILKELLDKKIKDEKEAEEILGLPVLGSISDYNKNK